MKKLFTLVATALVALCAGAQVNSTRVELSPLHIDADNSDKTTWKFVDTDITITNGNSKGYGSIDRYGDVNGDTCTLSWMKVSKDVEFKLNIPSDRAVVRIEFWGVSNSGKAMNWAYLHSLNNTAELPIYNQTGGATGNGRDIMDNEAIKALPYPYSPEAKNAETTPIAVFNDALGWFSELTFMFDGNNQVGTNIVVYTVPEADLANYKTETDASIRLSLDKPLPPVASTRVELSPLHIDADNSDKQTWKFLNTGATITNGNNKGYSSMDHYGDVNGDTCKLSWMKMSKDVEFKLNIPEDSAVVRIEFWGVSNSGAAMNWAYLHSLSNTTELPIVQGIDRDVMDNEAIKALPYPFSPEAKNAETTPVAVIADELGWFSELTFMYDGNNQVGANIVVYMVHESELENYKAAKDPSIRLSLDQPADPVASTRVELSPLYADFTNSVAGDWKFIHTGTTITNENNKSLGEAANYGDVNGDTCTLSFLKVSKDVEFKINIPADSAVVRVEFWGFSNSGKAMNWAYLHSLSNTSELPIVQGIDRDVMDNEAIKALPYPYSPEAKNAEASPVAVFNDNLGWFSELTFMFDGNNQVGTNIVLYMVHQDELGGYDWTVDPSIKSELDKPVIPDGIKLIPVVKTFNPNAPIYNLAGQRVTSNYKGIVIQNGKKFILR